MIPRILGKKILGYAKKYPVVTITGPRQSGKTTLARALFPKKPYRSLEDPDVRSHAATDPRGFMEEFKKTGVVLDEIQRVSTLLSYIQTEADKTGRAGHFILTGSQNFELLATISQTLAGRTALATLLPFAYEEVYARRTPIDLHKLLYTGFYPRIHDKKLNPSEALSFYVSTYVERDIRSLVQVKDLSKFELFLKLCASRTAQILNLAGLGNDCGINHNTAKSWLSVMETSYLIHLLRPHHQNFKKRLIKSPKLYFIDAGLAAYLLDIRNSRHLALHPLRGALFETFIVSELLKKRFNSGERSHLHYFRDNVGNEVDVLLDEGTYVTPIEIKLGKTVQEDYFKGLRYYSTLNPSGTRKPLLVYGGDGVQKRHDVEIMGWRNFAMKGSFK